jgi:hypothetical protein
MRHRSPSRFPILHNIGRRDPTITSESGSSSGRQEDGGGERGCQRRGSRPSRQGDGHRLNLGDDEHGGGNLPGAQGWRASSGESRFDARFTRASSLALKSRSGYARRTHPRTQAHQTVGFNPDPSEKATEERRERGRGGERAAT